MVLARGAADITNQLFGWRPRGRDEEFLNYLYFVWIYQEPRHPVPQITTLVTLVLMPDSAPPPFCTRAKNGN
jgi:hypothetical protein